MNIRTSVDPTFKLLALFVVLAGIPLAALGWLGWRLLEQDRTLESQRLRDQLENAATLLTREVDRSLATWEDLLSLSATSPGTGANGYQPLGVHPDGRRLVFVSGRQTHEAWVLENFLPAQAAKR